jgi:uncharacterized protein YndB with AHSA1/START domain
MTDRDQGRSAAENELLITRIFDAPVSVVFQIWERREHLIRWWGPKDFTCTSFDIDFRPGGEWRACIVSDAYGENWMGGRFHEIEKNKRIVFTFRWEAGRDQLGVETLVTVTFTEQDGKTVQTFHQVPFLTVEDRDSHVGGWAECFDREQVYVESLAKE